VSCRLESCRDHRRPALGTGRRHGRWVIEIGGSGDQGQWQVSRGVAVMTDGSGPWVMTTDRWGSCQWQCNQMIASDVGDVGDEVKRSGRARRRAHNLLRMGKRGDAGEKRMHIRWQTTSLLYYCECTKKAGHDCGGDCGGGCGCGAVD